MMILADAGIPMLGLYWPAAWLLFLPIVALEAVLAARLLRLTRRRAVLASLLANLASTLVGIPLTWIVLASLEVAFAGSARGLDTLPDAIYAVTVQAPWLMPYESALSWMIPAAIVSLSVPFLLVSVAAEYAIVRILFRDCASRALGVWAWRANAISYAGVALFAVVLVLSGAQWPGSAFHPATDAAFQVVLWIARAVHGTG